MKAAAQRLYEQRARQEVLSAVIRSMRGGGGDEVTPVGFFVSFLCSSFVF